jgi:hypothetical protein
MNKYIKYCPNVFIAECDKEHNKGDIITITTKYGKDNEHIVHNLIKSVNGKFYYSITRADGFNNQERAKNKAERRREWASKAENRSSEFYKKSQKDAEFLVLGEPIKIGHHSEQRHRNMIDNANHNMGKSVEFDDKAKEHRNTADYWDSLANKIDLSMPESLGYFIKCLSDAKEKYQFLKNNPDKARHPLEITYARKDIRELEKKIKIAKILWE